MSTCPTCKGPLETKEGAGRPKRYCSDRCRWKAGHKIQAKRERLGHLQHHLPEWVALQRAGMTSRRLVVELKAEIEQLEAELAR